jgi:WD40 repeat protein
MTTPCSSDSSGPASAPVYPIQAPTWKIAPQALPRYINSVAVSSDGGTVIGGTFYHSYSSAPEARRSSTIADKEAKMKEDAADTFGTYCYNGDGSLRWKREFLAEEGVYWVAVSADATKAAAGGYFSLSPKAGFVHAYDAQTGALLLEYKTAQRVNQVSLSADGSWLVLAAEGVVLFRFDTTAGVYVKMAEYTPDSSTDNDVISAEISADGSTVVFCDYDSHIGLLNNVGGTLSVAEIYTMPTGYCHMLSLTPDGTAFAAGGAGGVFHLFDVPAFISTGAPTYSFSTGSPDAIYGVGVSTDGSMLAGVVNVGSDSGLAYAATVLGGTPVQRANIPTLRNPNSVCMDLARGGMAVVDGHPDGTPGHFYLIGGIVSAPNSEVAATVQWQCTTGDMSWPVTISGDGSAIVGGSDDGSIYYFAR